MADHFIPQAYLRNWSFNNRDQVHFIRKTDPIIRKTNISNLCAVKKGDHNDYLQDPLELKTILQKLEPEYNSSKDKLLYGIVDDETIYVIAGIIACIVSCSPTAQRLARPSLKKLLIETAALLEKKGRLPKAPGHEAGYTFDRLIQEGNISLSLDDKYSQHFGIKGIERMITAFSNCEWEILLNNSNESPFLTSDYPIAIPPSKGHNQLGYKIVPLSPNSAIRIKPQLPKHRSEGRFGEYFSYSRSIIKRTEIEDINKLLVRTAEDHIIFKNVHDWIFPFVQKNKNYHVDISTITLRRGNRSICGFKTEIVKADKQPTKQSKPGDKRWFEFTSSIGSAVNTDT